MVLGLGRTALRSSLLAAMRFDFAGERLPLEGSSATWLGLGLGLEVSVRG